MRKNILLSLIILVCMKSFAQEVVLSSLNWEPYIGENLENQGYVAEIAKEAFAKEGYNIKIKFYPWKRTVESARLGKVDGYFPEYYSQDVEKDFYFSDEFMGGPLGLFYLKKNKIDFDGTMQSLKPYEIGVVRGYVNTEQFDNATYLHKQEVKDDATNVLKLIKGRIDLFVADQYVILNILKQTSPDKKDEFEFVALENKPLYICFPKSKPKSKILLQKFNSGLKKMMSDGTLERILKKHGFN